MAKIIQYFQKSLFGVILFVFCVNCNEKIKYSDNLVFRYNEHKNINSLDPAFAKDKANIWAVNQLFNGLVQMNDSMKVIPSIAKKAGAFCIEINPEETELSYLYDHTLRQRATSGLKSLFI